MRPVGSGTGLDQLAVGADHEPDPVDALPVHVAGLDVADVVVERPFVVGGLGGAFGAVGPRQQRLVGTGPRGYRLPADQGRPGGDALAGTAARPVLVVG